MNNTQDLTVTFRGGKNQEPYQNTLKNIVNNYMSKRRVSANEPEQGYKSDIQVDKYDTDSGIYTYPSEMNFPQYSQHQFSNQKNNFTDQNFKDRLHFDERQFQKAESLIEKSRHSRQRSAFSPISQSTQNLQALQLLEQQSLHKTRQNFNATQFSYEGPQTTQSSLYVQSTIHGVGAPKTDMQLSRPIKTIKYEEAIRIVRKVQHDLMVLKLLDHTNDSYINIGKYENQTSEEHQIDLLLELSKQNQWLKDKFKEIMEKDKKQTNLKEQFEILPEKNQAAWTKTLYTDLCKYKTENLRAQTKIQHLTEQNEEWRKVNEELNNEIVKMGKMLKDSERKVTGDSQSSRELSERKMNVFKEFIEEQIGKFPESFNSSKDNSFPKTTDPSMIKIVENELSQQNIDLSQFEEITEQSQSQEQSQSKSENGLSRQESSYTEVVQTNSQASQVEFDELDVYTTEQQYHQIKVRNNSTQTENDDTIKTLKREIVWLSRRCKELKKYEKYIQKLQAQKYRNQATQVNQDQFTEIDYSQLERQFLSETNTAGDFETQTIDNMAGGVKKIILEVYDEANRELQDKANEEHVGNFL